MILRGTLWRSLVIQSVNFSAMVPIMKRRLFEKILLHFGDSWSSLIFWTEMFQYVPWILHSLALQCLSLSELPQQLFKSWPIQMGKQQQQEVRKDNCSWWRCNNEYVSACQRARCVYIMSTMSTTSIECVTTAAPECIKWLQLYVYKDRDVSVRLIRRAESCGFKALVVTIDTPFVGIRLGEARSGFHVPPHLQVANFTEEPTAQTHIDAPKDGESALTRHSNEMFDSSLTWKDIEWLRSVTQLPILVKGILTSEDAVLAVKHGVDGIIVSNHGGRQLDTSPATVSSKIESNSITRKY